MKKTNYYDYSNQLMLEIKQRKKATKKKWIEIIRHFSYLNIKKEIESYGYYFRLKDIIKEFLYLLIGLLVLSYTCHLHFVYVGLLVLQIIVLYPSIIKNKYRQLYQHDRFEMVVSYIENIIPIFEAKPVIIYALREVVDLLDGEIKTCIEKAIDVILDNTEENNIYDKAFHYIEEKFPNSRVYATHHMMKTIETMNSKNYESMIMNLFLDVQAWVSRTYLFQKELTNRKVKLLFLTILTMASSSFFVGIFTTNHIFIQFVEKPLYQFCTYLFITACIFLLYMFYICMNGKWMVNDRTIKNEEKYILAFQKSVLKKQVKVSTMQWGMAFLFFLGGILLSILLKNLYIFIICLIMSVYICKTNERFHKKQYKKVKKALEIEFPIWLRDVCLNLQNYTVINAIEKSKQTASILMQFYIDCFLAKVKDNPTSIVPYNEFLKEYDIPDVKADLKVLFALSNHSERQMEKEVNALIVRNQEMIAKSERIRNEDYISIISRLGFLPVILFIMNMLMNMSLLFMYLMDFMNSAIHL